LAIWTLLAALAALILWRAYSLSFTIDEAYSYLNFTSRSTAVIFDSFHSNHHVLFTMLSKLAWKGFGVSEFTLRVPSVLAGLAFLVILVRVLQELLGNSWDTFLTFASIALNPLLLDLLSAARGYSLALAFWSAALLLAIRFTGSGSLERLAGAGLCLGLAVSASLTFVFPSIALLLMVVCVGPSAPGRPSASKRLVAAALPFVGSTLALLARSLANASTAQFYFGTGTFRQAFDTVMTLSIPGWEHKAFHLASAWLVEGFCWLTLGGAMLYFLARWRNAWSASTKATMICGTFLTTLSLLFLAHWTVGVKFPYSRTGIYLLVLTILSSAILARHSGRRAVLVPWCVLLILLTAAEVAAFRVRYFGEWITDADNKEIAAFLKSELTSADILCVSWELEPGMNFYREVGKLPVPLIARNDLSERCTVLALLPPDHELARRGNLAVLFRSPHSGVVVTRRR
jgi:hypothetical protein